MRVKRANPSVMIAGAIAIKLAMNLNTRRVLVKFIAPFIELAVSERMLIAVAAKYGKDSYEHEMAGGIRKSERKRPTRKADRVA